jgi:hypothetical protein
MLVSTHPGYVYAVIGYLDTSGVMDAGMLEVRYSFCLFKGWTQDGQVDDSDVI